MPGDQVDWINNIKNNPFIDPRRFGAKGDGSHNDNAAFQSAVNYLASNGGGTLLVPAGTFMLTQVFITSSVIIRGIGVGSTIIKRSNNSNTSTVLQTTAGTFSCEDITFDGNRANNPTQESAFIYFSGISFAKVRNCTFQNANVNTVVRFDDCFDCHVSDCVFINNLVHCCGFNQTVYQATRNRISGCSATFSTYTITSISNAGLVTTTLPNGFIAGQTLGIVNNSVAAYNGQPAIIAIVSPTSFTIAGGSGVGTGGTIIEGNFFCFIRNQGYAEVCGNRVVGGGENIQIYNSQHCVVSDNTLFFSSDSGITLIADPNAGASCSFNVVSNNTFDLTCLESIFVGDASIDNTYGGQNIVGNVFANNSITSPGQFAIAGRKNCYRLFSKHQTQTHIIGGLARGAADYAILLDTNGCGSAPSNTKIENVAMFNNSTGRVKTDGSDTSTSVLDTSNEWVFNDLGNLAAAAAHNADGSLIMVNNGTVASPVASGGSGCLAKRLNGVWVGN